MKDQLTPLKETGIYIVELPKDAKDFDITKINTLFYWINNNSTITIPLPKGSWQILGTITSDSISFDPATYLEKCFIDNEDTKLQDIFYMDYADKSDPLGVFIKDSVTSFRSLLNSCGYYWVNPLGPDICTHGENNNYCENVCQGSCWQKADIDSLEWQSFEDNLVTGILLALSKKINYNQS